MIARGRDILGVKMDESAKHALQPDIGIVSAEVTVAGIEIDTDARTVNEMVNPVEAFRVLGILLMGLDPEKNPSTLRHLCGLAQDIAHQHVVLLFSGPAWFRPFIGIDDGSADFGGKTYRLPEILNTDLRLAQWGMGGKGRTADIVTLGKSREYAADLPAWKHLWK